MEMDRGLFLSCLFITLG